MFLADWTGYQTDKPLARMAASCILSWPDWCRPDLCGVEAHTSAGGMKAGLALQAAVITVPEAPCRGPICQGSDPLSPFLSAISFRQRYPLYLVSLRWLLTDCCIMS